MRVIIAGSRECVDYALLERTLRESGFEVTVVISGCARGADTLGEWWARNNGVPIEQFPADWNAHGKRAGHIRNAQMAERADALIALWDGQSRGTLNMIQNAMRKRLPYRIGLMS